MPKVIQNHNTMHGNWSCKQSWPDDFAVQWGDHGIVLREKEKGGCYGTAFFEVFPTDNSSGFIRGEGSDLDAAEAQAFAEWQRFAACRHQWGRRGYTNGGARCIRCGSFQTIFQPIHVLGHWRKPLDASVVSSIRSGFCARSPWSSSDRQDQKWRRLLLLRARYHGIQIPNPPENPTEEEYEQYAAECDDIVLRWYAARVDAMPQPDKGLSMMAVFDRFALASLRRDAIQAGYLPPDTDAD